ncbi:MULTISPECIES: hypothetical protein [unclassified Synechocystis]|jgi:hypothetical protein|nr:MULTISPECIES: hypothetical protein [unclassified Synechocystis]
MNSPTFFEKGTTFYSKSDFNKALSQWYNKTDEVTIGDTSYSQASWIFIKLGMYDFQLNADTKRIGVFDYLQILKQYEQDLPWHIVENTRNSKINKAVFGEDFKKISGFYLYIKKALETTITI